MNFDVCYDFITMDSSGEFACNSCGIMQDDLYAIKDFMCSLNHIVPFHEEVRYIHNNIYTVDFLCLKQGATIVIRANENTNSLNKYYGFYFKEVELLNLWFFMDKVLLVLLNNDIDYFYQKNVITIEEYLGIEVDDLKLDTEVLDMYMQLCEALKQSEYFFDFSFGIGMGENVFENIRIFWVAEQRKCEKYKLDINKIESGFSDKVNYELVEWYKDLRLTLNYRFPSLKNRPHVEGFFKERKRIKAEIKAEKVFWEYVFSYKGRMYIESSYVAEKECFLAGELIGELESVLFNRNVGRID